MAIDWKTFKQMTKSYFKSMVARNEQEAADFITTQYISAILTGGDLSYGNIVTPTYNQQALSLAIGNAFIQGATLVNEGLIPTIFGITISQGLIGFWTGAQLSLLVPPPGSVVVVSNIVSVPGTIISVLNVSATENENEFVDNLVDFFTQHLQTLQGITTAIVPGTPPIPTPFPWQGYG